MAKKKPLTVDWAEAERTLQVLHVENTGGDGHTFNVVRDDKKGMGLIGCPICNENYGLVNGSWIDLQSNTHVPDGDLAMALMRIWMEAGKQQKAKSAAAGSGK